MARRLTLTDCDSVPGKDKIKPRIAANLINELTNAEVELPGSIPRLSLTIRAITCSGTKIKHQLELMRRLQAPVISILQAVHAKKIGITLPLADEDVKLLGAVDGLLRDLIRGYNSIIHEARDSIGFFGSPVHALDLAMRSGAGRTGGGGGRRPYAPACAGPRDRSLPELPRQMYGFRRHRCHQRRRPVHPR